MTGVARGMEQGSKLGTATLLCALALLSCGETEGDGFERSGAAGAAGGPGEAGATGTGGEPDEPWMFGQPLLSEKGEFHVANHDHRLIAGSWEALRVEESSLDLRAPFTVEFVDTDEVSVETVEGEPYRFHAKKSGSTLVRFRATDARGSVEDAFRFEVEEPVSLTMGACEQVLGGSGTDVSFFFNDRFGAFPQGLLPVEVSPASAAEVVAIDGYLASRFALPVAPGFVGSFDLRSTLPDGSSLTLRAVDPLELEPPRLFGRGSVGIGTPFTVAAEAWTARGVVCSPIPVTLVETEASACRVVRALPASFYEPFDRPKYELVGEVIGGICELVVQYDPAALEAILGAEGYAALPSEVTEPLTIELDIELREPAASTGTIDSSGGGGWD